MSLRVSATLSGVTWARCGVGVGVWGHLLARMCGEVFKLAWKGSAKVETRFLHSRGSVAVVTGWAGHRDVMQPASSATAGDHVVPLGAKNTQVGTLLLQKVLKRMSAVEAEE